MGNAVEGNKTSKDVAAAAVVDTLPLEGEEQVEGSIEGTKPQEKSSSSSTSQKKTKKKLPAKTSRSNRAGPQFPVGRVHRLLKEASQRNVGGTLGFTLPPSWSTLQLRFWSWLAMLPGR